MKKIKKIFAFKNSFNLVNIEDLLDYYIFFHKKQDLKGKAIIINILKERGYKEPEGVK